MDRNATIDEYIKDLQGKREALDLAHQANQQLRGENTHLREQLGSVTAELRALTTRTQQWVREAIAAPLCAQRC